jgi:hypothetical protein
VGHARRVLLHPRQTNEEDGAVSADARSGAARRHRQGGRGRSRPQRRRLPTRARRRSRGVGARPGSEGRQQGSREPQARVRADRVHRMQRLASRRTALSGVWVHAEAPLTRSRLCRWRPRLGRGSATGYVPVEQRRSFYGQLRSYALERGHKSGWAAHKFKEKFGTFPPWDWNRLPHEAPEPATRSWIRSREIAFAKSRAAA